MTNLGKYRFYNTVRKSARAMSFLITNAHLFLLAAFFLSPQGPHVRVDDLFGGYSRGCTYLGSRGLVPGYVPGCPYLVWIDSGRGT